MRKDMRIGVLFNWHYHQLIVTSVIASYYKPSTLPDITYITADCSTNMSAASINFNSGTSYFRLELRRGGSCECYGTS
jgi:hypothetical protein